MMAQLLAKVFSAKTLSLAACQSAVNSGLRSVEHTASTRSGIKAEMAILITPAAQGIVTRQGGDGEAAPASEAR